MPKPLSVLVEAISGKRSATDGEQDGQKGRQKHIKQQPGGTKDDVAMGGTSSGLKESAKGANKSTDAKLHNAVLKTLCVLSQQVREVRGAFMCWMIKQEAPEYKKPKEQLRAYSELAATKGKGHGLGPPGIAAFTGLLQALSVGAANAAGVANLKQTWDDMEPEGAFDLVPHCKLAEVYDPSLSRLELVISVAQHRKHTRGAPGQTGANRLLGQAPSELWNGHCQQRSYRPIRPRLRQDDWRQGVASDVELMDRANGKLVGMGGSAVSSTSGQLPTSAEIEKVARAGHWTQSPMLRKM